MKLLKVKNLAISHWSLVIFGLVVIVFFRQFFFAGGLPIPADTIVGMYHPWRDVVWDNFTAGVPFKNFLITDPVRQQYPWRKLAVSLVKQGELPLWNPYTHAGTPLLANFQSAVFYPFNVLFLLLPFNLTWGILIFLQPLLAGIFLYAYLCHLKLRKVACILGALSFSFSGFFIAWLEWGTILHSALWLPLILLSIDKIVFSIRYQVLSIKNRKLLLWGCAFIFSLVSSFFAGHLQTFFYLFIFSVAYFFVRWVQFGRKKSILLLFLILNTIFLILTSIQWILTLQFISLSARSIDQTQWTNPGWFIPWQNLVQFLAPDFFGNPTTLNYWGVFNYAEFTGFVGVIPLILAFYAIFWRRDRIVLFFSFFVFLFLSFSLPTPWAELPFKLGIPLVSTSQPTRLLFLVDFCLAVLAAFGIDAFLKSRASLKKIIITLMPFFLLYGFLWLFVLEGGRIWPDASWLTNLAVSKRNLILPTGMLIAFAGLIILYWFILKFFKKNKFIIPSVMLLLTAFDLLRFGWKFIPFTKEEWLFPETQTIEFLKNDKSVFRFMTTDRRLFAPNFSLPYQLQTVEGYDPLYLARYGELIAASERGEPNISPPFGFNRIITPHNYESRIMDLLNVKYVLSLREENSAKLVKVFEEGQTRVYENKDALPRAFMVYNYLVAQNQQEVINLLMDEKIDPAKTVILEETPTDSRFVEGENEIKIEDYRENKVVIKAETNKPGILILTDSYYPGWKTKVDGKVSKIYRADYNFRGIIVPEGTHEVIFEYDWH